MLYVCVNVLLPVVVVLGTVYEAVPMLTIFAHTVFYFTHLGIDGNLHLT